MKSDMVWTDVEDEISTSETGRHVLYVQCTICSVQYMGKLVTEKPVDFAGFDNVVEFYKTQQNDDNVVKVYKDLLSWNSLKKKPVNWLKLNAYICSCINLFSQIIENE